MATAFRIHEDIENNTEPTRNEKKNLVGKNNGKDKRPTLAILNSVALDNRNNATHAHKSVSLQYITYLCHIAQKKIFEYFDCLCLERFVVRQSIIFRLFDVFFFRSLHFFLFC